MSKNFGVVYVAVGESARQEASKSIASLLEHEPDCAFHIITEENSENKHGLSGRRLAAWLKAQSAELSPFDATLYVDADTRFLNKFSKDIVEFFDNGYECLFTASLRQGNLKWQNAGATERAITEVRTSGGANIAGGVFAFSRNDSFQKMAKQWATNIVNIHSDVDQPSLIRALYNNPVKMFLLDPFIWNCPVSQPSQECKIIHKFKWPGRPKSTWENT